MKSITYILLIHIIFSVFIPAQENSGFKIARLKYNGGGDWYNDPSSEINLLKYISEKTSIKIDMKTAFVEAGTPDIFNYPFIFITGHGNISLSDQEAANLRSYIEKGGFIYADDDYGFDKSFRKALKKIFPEDNLVEIPFSYGIYNCFYKFNSGPPKTHEHDNNPPRGYGLFINGRLAVYYTYESNPSDGWADPEVHNDPPEIREKALQFGVNIIIWALTN